MTVRAKSKLSLPSVSTRAVVIGNANGWSSLPAADPLNVGASATAVTSTVWSKVVVWVEASLSVVVTATVRAKLVSECCGA